MTLIDKDALKKDVLDLQDCYNGFSDTYDKACIIGVIDEQPTIEECKWIPCSERLPRKGEQVLCSNKKGSVFTSAYTYTDSRGVAVFGQHLDVIAWMPLPESYSGETKLRDYENKGDDD